ncbi:unnamed protein product [Polarella glacialis]|uniref:Uncharacterized protein n=1 Tax=Polarella glacialis TaxID=89957 RepID=A0A813DQD0_POLGL|nr:unnamed protein product [Polarella glacialis]
MALPTSAEQARKTLIIRTEDELKAFRLTEGDQEEQEGEQNEQEEQDDEDEDENLTAEECRLQKEFADEQRFQFSRIVSATRLHLPPEAEEIPEATADHLRKYVSQAKMLGVVAAIAVNGHVDEVSRIAEETEPGFKVNILHVPCWGAFVPALNALLNFAQGKGKKYILYQSLEVCCARDVLQRLLDHHTADTLVVGPVVDGHVFCDGEQPLNGRSSPWNTLALWSVRKLALTGFLCIADGLPDVPPSVSRETSMAFADELNPQDSMSSPMGSDGWWSHSEGASGPFGRQQSAPVASVPAGVEEVTAIALLQHLHGSDRSRAVLVKLPPHLEAKMSWAASWGQDEKRKKWHKYKMASKAHRFSISRHVDLGWVDVGGRNSYQLSAPGSSSVSSQVRHVLEELPFGRFWQAPRHSGTPYVGTSQHSRVKNVTNETTRPALHSALAEVSRPAAQLQELFKFQKPGPRFAFEPPPGFRLFAKSVYPYLVRFF